MKKEGYKNEPGSLGLEEWADEGMINDPDGIHLYTKEEFAGHLLNVDSCEFEWTMANLLRLRT